MQSNPESQRLRPSGGYRGYRQLRDFRVTTILYDATVKFCRENLEFARGAKVSDLWTRDGFTNSPSRGSGRLTVVGLFRIPGL